MSFSLTGIASGLDTTTIISQLMELEKVSYTKLQTKQTTLNSELTFFRSVNTKLSALRTAAEDLLLQSNFNLRSATNSDESVLKASVSEYVGETTYRINVTQLASQHIVKSQEISVNDTLTGSITINDHIFTLDNSGNPQTPGSNETIIDTQGLTNDEILTKLMEAINNQNVGAKASILETSPDKKRLVLTSEKAGEANKIEFTDNSSVFALSEVGDSAKNAKLTINGIDIEASTNDLSNVITGMSLTLYKTGETTVTVTRDLDKIASKVETFVKAYNDVINTIKTNTAKGANLQGDSTLRSLESTLSGIFNRNVNFGTDDQENLKYMFDIGLEIDKGKTKASEMTGEITFDKDKFKAALTEDPDMVYKMFSMDESSSNKKGIALLFKESLMDWTRSGTGIIASRIEGYNSEISLLTTQLEDMQTRLDAKEERLKKQFANMETALATLQNQQSWLTSQIASLSTSY